MADPIIIGSRINVWNKISKALLKATHYLGVDISTEITSQAIMISDVIGSIGTFTNYPIGSWDLRTSYYKELSGINAGDIPISVTIFDDDGVAHTNVLWDAQIMAYFCTKMEVASALTGMEITNQYGQNISINVWARNHRTDNTKLIIQHNCPSLLTNNENYDTFTYNASGDINGFSDEIAIDGNTTLLRIGDQIQCGDVLAKNTRIIDIITYENITGDMVQTIVMSTKQLLPTVIVNPVLTVLRPKASFNHSVNNITEISGGVPLEKNGYFITPNANVLLKFSNSTIMPNRGFVTCITPYAT